MQLLPACLKVLTVKAADQHHLAQRSEQDNILFNSLCERLRPTSWSSNRTKPAQAHTTPSRTNMGACWSTGDAGSATNSPPRQQRPPSPPQFPPLQPGQLSLLVPFYTWPNAQVYGELVRVNRSGRPAPCSQRLDPLARKNCMWATKTGSTAAFNGQACVSL